MRNNKLVNCTLIPLINLVVSIILTILIMWSGREIIWFLYKTTTIEIINYIVWMIFDNNQLILTIAMLLMAFIFTILSYRKAKFLSEKLIRKDELEVYNRAVLKILEKTEYMKNGDIDTNIPEIYDGYPLELAKNINNIVIKLKNITTEEKRAQQTKTDLITNVSHDLRTPLTSIMGYLSLIERDEYRDEIQLRHYTVIAYQKAKALNILINDLFELTKMQNSGVTLNRSKIDLVELIGQIMAQFQYELSSANMVSRLFFSDDRLIISGDGNKLVRAIENIITNAIKYGKDGIYIDIKTYRVDSSAVIEIVNYGEEILQTDLEFIFDRFYRIEKSRNREAGGTGLGLSITKSIIELHNGNICAISEEGKTIFRVEIPSV